MAGSVAVTGNIAVDQLGDVDGRAIVWSTASRWTRSMPDDTCMAPMGAPLGKTTALAATISAVTLPAIWPIKDNPVCHRVAKLGKSVGRASGNEQKITLGKGNRLVAHLEFSAALCDNISLIT